MVDRAPPGLAASRVPSSYRVHLLPDPKPTERGVLYRRGGRRFILAWSRVRRAFASQVGDTGDGTTVFDLVIQATGPECVVCRMDAAPGEESMRVARAIQLAIGPGACSPCLQSLASEGLPSQIHSDLDVFAESVLEAVRFG